MIHKCQMDSQSMFPVPCTCKELMVPLRREDRGIKDDPQFSPYYPSYKFIVFFDYGHPTAFGSKSFRTKGDALTWIKQQGVEVKQDA